MKIARKMKIIRKYCPLLMKVILAFFLLTHASRADNYDDEFSRFDEKFTKQNTVEIYDPLEKINRKVFGFNEAVDKYFIQHLVGAYQKGVPKPIKKSVRNFLTNLSIPISCFNSILQGKTDNSLATFSSFIINTTLGVGGLFDIAHSKKIDYEKEDFGRTLLHYKIKSGAYLILPILGPSSLRDFGGSLVDKSLDPLSLNYAEIGGEREIIKRDEMFILAGASSFDTREKLDSAINDLRKESLDLYASIRSVYLQNRNFQVE
jgi:phospholipid-binding lipoprotein MlaA